MATITIEIVELAHERKWTIEYRYSKYSGNAWHVNSLGGNYFQYDTLGEVLLSSLVPKAVRQQLRQLLSDSKYIGA